MKTKIVKKGEVTSLESHQLSKRKAPTVHFASEKEGSNKPDMMGNQLEKLWKSLPMLPQKQCIPKSSKLPQEG